MEKYRNNLLKNALALENMLDRKDIVQKTMAVIDEDDSESAVAIMKIFAEINRSRQYSEEIKKAVSLLNESLIFYLGYKHLSDICKADEEPDDNKSLDELMDELNGLIGLENVKTKVKDLIIYQQVQKMRSNMDLHTSKGTMHMAFIGNPGTGKTTVARIVGRVYKQIGLLSKGHFTEVSRTDLIAGYQGQTALKVKKVIERSKGGVLFIDEAYSITENDHSDSYGRECLTELTKALEDYRDDLVVIVAGYKEPMKKFFESNPGLLSRFNIFIEFEDYSADELLKILESICKHNDYILNDDLKTNLALYFQNKVSEKGENFANGRLARNIYDNLIMNHAKRVIKIENPFKEDLQMLTDKDFHL